MQGNFKLSLAYLPSILIFLYYGCLMTCQKYDNWCCTSSPAIFLSIHDMCQVLHISKAPVALKVQWSSYEDRSVVGKLVIEKIWYRVFQE